MAAIDTNETALPEYARTQKAFHRAFARDLRQAVAALPLEPTTRVLDVPCGDGFYTMSLARRLAPRGKIVAADLSTAFLQHARNRFARQQRVAPVEFVEADVYRLPFEDSSFDLVWCAESLITLKDPIAALKEMRRVVRPGGTVAVLEADAFHCIMVNWSVELEVHLHTALATAIEKKYGSPANFSPARRVRRWLQAAGLQPRRKRTLTADRQFPFPPRVQQFLQLHFRETRDLVAEHLAAEHLELLDRMIDPENEKSILQRTDAELACLTTLFLAQK